MSLKNFCILLVVSIVAAGLFIFGRHYYRLATASQNWSPEILFCKQWKTVCDPSYTDPNGGCAPVDVCVDKLEDQSAVVYKTKEACESQTSSPCDYSVCDLIPEGKTAKEACGNRIKKGWYPKILDNASKTSDIKTACEQKEGTWLEEYNECESHASDKGLDQKSCNDLGGKYADCASACRNSSPNGPCIAVCVKVCQFD